MSKKIAIVIPVLNEQENIQPLTKRLVDIIRTLPDYSFEVLFVDDGSKDNTLGEIEKVMSSESIFGYVQLSRNFGHQNALEAGIANARAEAIITMDGDLQHPPEMIPAMIEAYENGADIVQMQRKNFTEDIKAILSISFYSFFKWVSDTPIVPNAADFRLMSARVREEILKSGNGDKLLRAILPSLGFRQVNIEYHQEKRFAGKASYSYLDLYELAIVTIFNFSKFPAHFVFFGGMIVFLIGIVATIFKSMVKLSTESILLLIVGGLILISSGIICWFLYFILEQLKRGPTFIIQKIVYPREKNS